MEKLRIALVYVHALLRWKIDIAAPVPSHVNTVGKTINLLVYVVIDMVGPAYGVSAAYSVKQITCLCML